MDVCDVCNSPGENGGAALNTHLIRCSQCGVYVHPVTIGERIEL